MNTMQQEDSMDTGNAVGTMMETDSSHTMNTMEIPGMAMEEHGAMVFGLPLVTFLFFASALVYAICAVALWKPFRRERNELITALFAFFIYQTISMLFMALEMNTMNMLYSSISSLAVFIGSIFMIRFLYSNQPQTTRRMIFMLSLIVVLGMFIWFTQTAARETMLMNFTLWYDLIVNGIFVGGAIIYAGIKATQNWAKIKAIGGGSGVVACCVVSSATMLGGALLTSSAFQFIAPVVILGSLSAARRAQQKATIPANV